jgi:predicted XRE-type DNA-binding protein
MRSGEDDVIVALRLQLASEIVRSLGPGAQHVVAWSYDIRQPQMSELGCGKVGRFSIEWLIRRIHRLGGSVEVSVSLGDARSAWRRESFARMRARRSARPEDS